MRFEAVPAAVDFPALEQRIAARWEEGDVFARSVAARAGAPAGEFVFYEGPPTANGRPGLHHVWARTFKDLFCRYQTMRGHQVVRRAGWDTHGLPVEVEVERELGLPDKRAVEAYGIAEFVERCRASVRRYVGEWERLTDRMGYWVDMEHAYWTLDPSYVQSVWWHLRQLSDRGLLVEGVKVVPYCPRCGTSLSSHELGQPEVYREIEDVSPYVRLALETPGPAGATALAVWTTTPWTLVSNTGVAVHPEVTYAVVDGLVVAAARADAVLGEGALARASATLPGSALVGLRYRRPFELVAAPPDADGWRVVAADFVTTEEGTGLVHLAPAFGADDADGGRSEGLPLLNPVGPDGTFGPEAGWLAGREVREANGDIVAALERDGLLIRAEAHRHSYPHCWRCGTPLLYWAKPSWFVRTSAERSALLAANEGVTWRPEHLKEGRFGEWLAHNVDWALSRDRFWGTPLPIWRCDNGHLRCVASLAELSALAGRDVTGVDPHRPAIDEVTFSCPDCGGDTRRVEEVVDAWFDSGSMPAAQWGYPAVPGSAEAFRFPAGFVCEGVDQTRGWFYSLLAVNVLVHGAAPYRAVLSVGHIVDADGRKMSKSLGNVLDPFELLDSRGADPLRWWMVHQGSPWTSTRTSLAAIDASTADVLVTLWNTWSFFATYATLEDFSPDDPAIPEPAARSELDRWCRSRVHGTVAAVTAALDDYQPQVAAVAVGELVDDLSNWYVRRSRRRFWRTGPGADRADSLAAQATLHEALRTVALLLAPFCPFFADAIWQGLAPRDLAARGEGGMAADGWAVGGRGLAGNQGAGSDRGSPRSREPGDVRVAGSDARPANGRTSVHLEDWPVADPAALDPALEAAMAEARRVVSLGRAARAEARVKVRQPLRRALVVAPPGRQPLLREIVAEELNVDEVLEAEGLAAVLDVSLVPNFRLLGPRLGAKVAGVREALGRLDARVAAESLEAGQALTVQLDGDMVSLEPGEVEIRVQPRAGFAVSREGREAVALDLALDDELRHRGLVRDLLRQLQEARRSAGLAVSDRVDVWLGGLDGLGGDAALLGSELLAVAVHFVASEEEVPADAVAVSLELGPLTGRDAPPGRDGDAVPPRAWLRRWVGGEGS